MSETIEIRVTKDNVDTAFRRGDVIVGAEDLGPVLHVRLTRNGFADTMVYGELGTDILGLPSTVQVRRS